MIIRLFLLGLLGNDIVLRPPLFDESHQALAALAFLPILATLAKHLVQVKSHVVTWRT